MTFSIPPLNSEDYWLQVPGYLPEEINPHLIKSVLKVGEYIVYRGSTPFTKNIFYLDKCTESYGSMLLFIEMHPGLQKLALKINVLGEERWAETFPDLLTLYFRFLEKPVRVISHP